MSANERPTRYKKYILLIIWILGLIFIGFIIGSSTKTEVNNWYKNLNRSPLSPPNYWFGIVWTILYAMIGFSGFLIWEQNKYTKKLYLIKILYLSQLILNFSWTPLFFSYHMMDASFLFLMTIICLVACIIYLSYEKIRLVTVLMVPYLFWLLFAAHLNFYIWQNN